MTKRIELRVPMGLFNTLKSWSHQKNATISSLVREAMELVYRHREKTNSPLVNVLGIINDKKLCKNIDKYLYGENT